MTPAVDHAVACYRDLQSTIDTAPMHVTFAPLVAATANFSADEWAAYYAAIGPILDAWIPERMQQLKNIASGREDV